MYFNCTSFGMVIHLWVNKVAKCKTRGPKDGNPSVLNITDILHGEAAYSFNSSCW